MEGFLAIGIIVLALRAFSFFKSAQNTAIAPWGERNNLIKPLEEMGFKRLPDHLQALPAGLTAHPCVLDIESVFGLISVWTGNIRGQKCFVIRKRYESGDQSPLGILAVCFAYTAPFPPDFLVEPEISDPGWLRTGTPTGKFRLVVANSGEVEACVYNLVELAGLRVIWEKTEVGYFHSAGGWVVGYINSGEDLSPPFIRTFLETTLLAFQAVERNWKTMPKS